MSKEPHEPIPFATPGRSGIRCSCGDWEGNTSEGWKTKTAKRSGRHTMRQVWLDYQQHWLIATNAQTHIPASGAQ